MNTVEITEEKARETYESYMEEGLRMFPPFKGYGMNVIRFAMDEPQMYKLLFCTARNQTMPEYLDKQWEIERLIPIVSKSLELNGQEAAWLVKNSLLYAHGIAMLLCGGIVDISFDEVSTNFGSLCRGLIMQLKAPTDERTKIVPNEGLEVNGSVEEYIKGKKKMIIGYGSKREMYQIRVDAILYFEAVGENVFAYTKGNVYEIKQRLYKIEEEVSAYSFVRASKSLLVNIRKVCSMTPEIGGRGLLNMINGETVIASRSYYKHVVSAVRENESA